MAPGILSMRYLGYDSDSSSTVGETSSDSISNIAVMILLLVKTIVESTM